MTKCIITGKTYPDYKPQQHRSINSARKNMEYGLGQLDWLNAEQMNMANKLYQAIQHLHQNRAHEFSQSLMQIAETSGHYCAHRKSRAYDDIEEACHTQNKLRQGDLVPINTVRQPVFLQAVAVVAEYILQDTYLDPIWVTDDNGDERYTDESQERFNEHHDAVEGILSELLDVKDAPAKPISMRRFDDVFESGYFEPDDVCRNGKPIADCECC